MMRPRILIADDHTLVAQAIAGLLATEYEIVGISSNGRQLLADAVQFRPDLIVLDISMPEMNGIDATVTLRRLLPEAGLVLVTQQVDPHYIEAAFRAGALGYVAKQSAAQELHQALRQALRKKVYLSSQLRSTFPDRHKHERSASADPGHASLTIRQREVLRMVAEGRTIKEIAAALYISPKTVEFHKKSLMDQTGLRTTAELTRFALASGVIGH